MIIIPTYNESGNIRQLISRIRVLLPQVPVLFVDDNSTDGTGDEIKKLQVDDKNILLISRPGKLGFASAHLDGIKYALASNDTDFIITMDADLSHPPEILPEMIESLRSFDVVIGSRYIEGGGVKNWDLKRKILSRFANWYARVFTGLNIRDVTAGFVGYRKEFLKRIDLGKIKSHGYAYLMESKNLIMRKNPLVKEIPIIFAERTSGTSKIGTNIILEGIRYPIGAFLGRASALMGLLAFFVPVFVYLLTMPHKIYLGDSAEYIAAGATLGIAHPSGNSAYVILSHIFSWLPFGTIPFRIGLLSVLSAGIGLVIFYQIFSKLIFYVRPAMDKWAGLSLALATTLTLAFSNIFWSQAIMAKVYALVFMVVMIILLMLIKYLEIPKNNYIYLVLFLIGLGLGIHNTILLLAPVVLGVFVYKNSEKYGGFKKQIFSGKFVLACFGLFLLGSSINLYLPLRAGQHPGYDFSVLFRRVSPAESMNGFFRYISRADYDDTAKNFIVADKAAYLAGFGVNVIDQFKWFLVFAIPGLVLIWRNARRYFYVTTVIFLLNSIGLIFLRSTHWHEENDFYYSFYYIVAYAVTALWMGLGLSYFFRTRSPAGGAIIIMLMPGLLFAQNYKVNDLSSYDFSENYTRSILTSLPQNAILLYSYDGLVNDSAIFGLHYQQIVSKLRPDVTILGPYDIHREVDYKVLAWIYNLSNISDARYYLVQYVLKKPELQNRPIFTTYSVDGLHPSADPNKVIEWTSVSNGLVYQLFQTQPTNFVQTGNGNSINYEKDEQVLLSTMFGKDLLAQYFYEQAAYFASKQDLKKTQENYIKAINLDDQVAGIDQEAFIEDRNNFFAN